MVFRRIYREMKGCWKSVGCVIVDFGRALLKCRRSDDGWTRDSWVLPDC